MPLHQSLADLSELAAHCQSPATARGLLAEAQDLLHNSLDHSANELELATWFSRIITDIVRSPGVASPVRLSGPVARGDALPSMAITWLGEDPQLESIFRDVGLVGHPAEENMASRADAGLALGVGSEDALLKEALDLRPPALKVVDGLPDRNAPVDIQGVLLAPIAAIARWAATAPRPTPDRLAIGVERELLDAAEAEALSLAWGTGIALELRQWHAGVNGRDGVLATLPPLDRTAYGSACRTVSANFESIDKRQKDCSTQDN